MENIFRIVAGEAITGPSNNEAHLQMNEITSKRNKTLVRNSQNWKAI